MPSHTFHFLQPLDRSVFKSLKTNFYEQCRLWLQQYPNRQIKRSFFGELLNKAWIKAATPGNAISSFKATGVFPFNPAVIPDHAFFEGFADSESQNITEVTTAVQIPVDVNQSISQTLPSPSKNQNRKSRKNLKNLLALFLRSQK